MRRTLDFRFYDMPKKDPILVFCGEKWRRVYGQGAPNLHFHNILEIGICREGQGIMQYADHEEDYHAGEISIVPRNVPHNTMNVPGEVSFWEYLFIDAHHYLEKAAGGNGTFVETTEERINARPNLILQMTHPEITDAVNGIIREKTEPQHYSEEITNALVISLLFGIARVNRSFARSEPAERMIRNRVITDALEYIERHYMEQITIGELASSVNLSETHFRRVFKEYMHMAPADYLNMVRVQQACSLMLKTDDPIELISRKTGFTTPSTFNRNFRTYMNETPLKWKKAHAGSGAVDSGISVTALKGWDDDTR